MIQPHTKKTVSVWIIIGLVIAVFVSCFATYTMVNYSKQPSKSTYQRSIPELNSTSSQPISPTKIDQILTPTIMQYHEIELALDSLDNSPDAGIMKVLLTMPVDAVIRNTIYKGRFDISNQESSFNLHLSRGIESFPRSFSQTESLGDSTSFGPIYRVKQAGTQEEWFYSSELFDSSICLNYNPPIKNPCGLESLTSENEDKKVDLYIVANCTAKSQSDLAICDNLIKSIKRAI